MIKVLLVDDSPGILKHHENGLKSQLDVQVFTACNGKEAIAALESCPVEVIISDLSMPVMDGFALLAYLKRRHPNLPVIVATSIDQSQLDKGLFSQGSLPILKKPVEPARLAREVQGVLTELSLGHLAGITLPSLLQLLQWERKSCSLFITSKERRGRLHFLSGELVDAFLFENASEGEVAAKTILAWEDVDVEIERSHHNHKRQIGKELTQLLIEVAQGQDEQKQGVNPPSPAPQTDELARVADAAMLVLDKLLSSPRPPTTHSESVSDLPADAMQTALITLLERVCLAEEALADVMQAVAVLLEERKNEQRLSQNAKKEAQVSQEN